MLLIALALLPFYFVALGLLLLFYQKFHVWKKEGVSVGFVYDKSPEVKTNISSFLVTTGDMYQHIPQSIVDRWKQFRGRENLLAVGRHMQHIIHLRTLFRRLQKSQQRQISNNSRRSVSIGQSSFLVGHFRVAFSFVDWLLFVRPTFLPLNKTSKTTKHLLWICLF